MNAQHPADDRLIDYALGELELPDRKDIETHLQSCETCRSVVVALTGALDSVRRAEPPEPPAHILVDLLNRQTAVRECRVSRPWFSKPIGAVAAAIVLVGIFAGGFLAGRQTTPAPGSFASRADTLGAVHHPLPEPPDIPFQTALAPVSE